MKKWLILLSVLSILIVAGIFIVPKFTVQQAVLQNPTCSGGQVISVDSVNIRDSAELGKKVIRVVFSTIPTAECLDISLSPSLIESELKESGVTNFDATKSIIGDINLISSSKSYTINPRTDQKIRKLTVQPISLSLLEFCTVNTCKNKGNAQTLYALKSETFGGCNCILNNEIGYSGEFLSSESLQWKTQVSISGLTADLSNTQLSAKMGNIAFVKWAGNLASNDNLGSISRSTYFPYTTNAWRMVNYANNGDYVNSQYEETKRNILSTCYQTISPLFPELQSKNFVCPEGISKASAYNSLVETRTTDGLSAWKSSETLVKNAVISSNKLIVDLKSPIVYPQFTLDIDASQVGIFITKGKPLAVCPSSALSFNSGEQKQATFKVQNIGAGSGAFDYTLRCDKGNQAIQPSPPQNINAGSSLSVTATLGLTVLEGKQTSNCEFKATEMNTLETSSCTYSYSATKTIKCIEGSTSCEQGNSELWTCKTDGSYAQIKCPNGCEVFESAHRCRLTAEEPVIPEPLCDPILKFPDSFLGWTIIPALSEGCLGLLGSAKALGALVLALIGAFLLWRFFRKEKVLQSSKKKPYNGIIQFVLLTVVFLALFSFTFKLFWYGLILGIIILVATFLIKRASGGLI